MTVSKEVKELLYCAREALERNALKEACMVMSDNFQHFEDYKSAIDTLNEVCETSLSYTVYCTGNREFTNDSYTDIEVVDGVTEINFAAFAGCVKLLNVKLPSSLNKIRDHAFWGCKDLINIKIPNGVTVIGDLAFFNCLSLTNIAIPNSVTYIGKKAFAGCEKLQSMIIPNSVTKIGYQAFQGCLNLKLIKLPSQLKKFNSKALGIDTFKTKVEFY